MPLKALIKTAEEIPVELKEYYKQDGTNGYVIDVEGMEPATRVEEFRTNNRNLNRELNEEVKPKLKKYEDVGTAEDFQHLKDISSQLDEGKLVRSGKLEEAVEARLTKVKDEHAKELNKEKGRAEALQRQLSSMMIDNATMEAATKLGAKDTALTDIVARMRSMFRVEEGKLVCYGPNGERDYGTSGQGATIEEKLTELMPKAPHLFKENQGGGGEGGGGGSEHHKQQGGGGSGGGGGGRYNGPNPWKPETRNLTLRMKLTKDQPALAKRLRAEAGVRESA